MINMSLSETDCASSQGNGWMDFYSYYTSDPAMPVTSIMLKSDNSPTNASDTTGIPCTYKESNHTITVRLTLDTIQEFTNDGDSSFTQFIYTI